ncbi:MAG: Copper binding protein plastocyanin/azurin family [Gaiellales bacterium]|nr:Copper binding protein plastocyanin/azurin family [Gaiellales bacterium]
MHPVRLTALAFAAAALAAPAAATAATPIKVSEKEFSISGMPKTLKHGVKYTITVVNKGKYPHDLLIDGKRLHDVGIHNKQAVAPGAKTSFSLTFPAAGRYEFYCAIKGHAAKGMKGKLKVT